MSDRIDWLVLGIGVGCAFILVVVMLIAFISSCARKVEANRRYREKVAEYPQCPKCKGMYVIDFDTEEVDHYVSCLRCGHKDFIQRKQSRKVY